MFSVFGDFGQSQIFTVKIRGVLPSQEGKQLYVGADKKRTAVWDNGV